MIALFLWVAADVRVATSDQLEAAVRTAKPGTAIVIGPGEYRGFQAAGLRGVTLRGADPRRAPVFRGAIQLSDIERVELESLTIEGPESNCLNIDDAGTYETPSRFVTLRDLRVRDCGGAGNTDGIKLSGVQDFRLESCTVERWGRKGSAVDMVGCRRGMITRSLFRDSEHNPAATGVQMKGGSREITVRECRFEEAGTRAVNIGGSTGMPFFRPKPEGFEAKDIVVEDSTFVGSMAPVAFVGVDGASFRYNTIWQPGKWVVRILQETRDASFVPSRNGRFERNLVVYDPARVATRVNIGAGTAPETFTTEPNYWFDGRDAGQDPRFADPGRGDFRLRPESPAKGFGARELAPRAILDERWARPRGYPFPPPECGSSARSQVVPQRKRLQTLMIAAFPHPASARLEEDCGRIGRQPGFAIRSLGFSTVVETSKSFRISGLEGNPLFHKTDSNGSLITYYLGLKQREGVV